MFIHHVFFYLKNPNSEADKQALIEGLRGMVNIEGLRQYHIGVVADTHRDVVNRSYQVSWLNVFDNPAAQEKYQDDPVHHAFIKNCAHLWQRVEVYDSEEA